MSYIVINEKRDADGLEEQYWVFFRLWCRFGYEIKREQYAALGKELRALKLVIDQKRGKVPCLPDKI